MTYSAPRQKLFAIVLLISFCLHTLLFILSTDRQITENRLHKATKIVDQLISEATLSLSYEDRVSLSVIVSRYTSEHDVKRIVIRNAEGTELIKIGESPMDGGANVNKLAVRNNAIIGKVELTMKSTDKAEIFKTSKIFILGAFLIHLLLWIVYIAFARPTKEQLKLLSKDIHKHYLQKYGIERFGSDQIIRSRESISVNQQAISKKTEEINDNESLSNTNKRQLRKKEWGDIRSSINQKVRDSNISQKDIDIYQTENLSNASSNVGIQKIESGAFSESSLRKYKYTLSSPTVEENDIEISLAQDEIEDLANKNVKHEIGELLLEQKEPEETSLSKIEDKTKFDSQPVNSIIVQCNYIDKHDLLRKLSADIAEPYLKLCTQLMLQAITELLKLNIFQGVILKESPEFTVDGVRVDLYHEADDQNKLALSGVILGLIFKMINEFVYEKHREISRFALTIAIGISQPGRENAMMKLIENKANDHDILVLLAKTETNFVERHINLHYLPNPTNVSERECAFVDGADDAINANLIDIRNKVLRL